MAKFKECKVGGSFIVPWLDCARMGLKRPEGGATLGLGRRTYKMEPTHLGIKVTRLE